ncbi:MAG: hypothetical protein JSV88_27740 [Candidatus Aminicenantes bacterium]|nr:MAG: hypothetical protein JSV88_27740 [Candidatus Aminicenantes bacterium]
MTKLPGLRGKFQLVRNLPKGLIIKVAMVLVLSIIAVLLFYTNKDLMKKNQKMIKYIKNEEVFKRELMHLKKSENQFEKYIVKVGKNAANADLEKIKSGYIDELLDMIKKDNLQVDSYRSEIQESDGFAIFKYNITIVGDFIQVLRFLNRLLEQTRHIYVSRYDIRLHISTLVRMGLTVDIIGME